MAAETAFLFYIFSHKKCLSRLILQLELVVFHKYSKYVIVQTLTVYSESIVYKFKVADLHHTIKQKLKKQEK